VVITFLDYTVQGEKNWGECVSQAFFDWRQAKGHERSKTAPPAPASLNHGAR
jgi:hypothetical protein